MQVATQLNDQTEAATRHKLLTRHAEQLVSQHFFGTLLKQARNSPFRSELWDGGRGGQAFGAMFDQKIAERMAKGVAAPLVQSIVKRLERTFTRRGEGQAPAEPGATVFPGSAGASPSRIPHNAKAIDHVTPTPGT